MRKQHRKVKDTDLTTYNWAQVPRRLVSQAIAKGQAEQPPISLKWKLIELVAAWLKE